MRTSAWRVAPAHASLDGQRQHVRHGDPTWHEACRSQGFPAEPCGCRPGADLRAPAPQHLNAQRSPLLERNPVLFWRSLALVLALVVVVLAGLLAGVFPERR